MRWCCCGDDEPTGDSHGNQPLLSKPDAALQDFARAEAQSALSAPDTAPKPFEGLCSNAPITRTMGECILTYAYASLTGVDPTNPKKKNQDTHLCKPKFDGMGSDCALFGVFDGHGARGHIISQFAAGAVPQQLKDQSKKGQTFENAWPAAFSNANEQLDSIESISSQTSGTTAACCIIKDGVIHTANVGDSRIVLARRKNRRPKQLQRKQSGTSALNALLRSTLSTQPDSPGSLSFDASSGRSFDASSLRAALRTAPALAKSGSPLSPRSSRHSVHNSVGEILQTTVQVSGPAGMARDRTLVAESLTIDQTPYRPDERERVKAAGGLIMTMAEKNGNWDSRDENWDQTGSLDPPRVWDEAGALGCAFTRSIGDQAGKPLGITAEPEISSRRLLPEDKFIIIASDGVWQFLSNEAVVQLVDAASDPLDACIKVVKQAKAMWNEFERGYVDDITIVCIAVEGIQNDPQRPTPQPSQIQMDQALLARKNSFLRPLGASVEPGPSLNASGKVKLPTGFQSIRKRQNLVKLHSMAYFMGLYASVDSSKMEIAGEVEQQGAQFDSERPPRHASVGQEKSAEDLAAIKILLSRSPLFQLLSDREIQDVTLLLNKHPVTTGTVLFRVGDPHQLVYLVQSGKYNCVSHAVGTPVDEGYVAHVFQSGGMFGERSLLTDRPHSKSAVCAQGGTLWSLSRTTFLPLVRMRQSEFARLLEPKTDEQLERVLHACADVRFLNQLPRLSKRDVVSMMVEVETKAGEILFRPGDTSDLVYVVESGICSTLEIPSGGTVQDGIEVHQIEGGGSFGERALLRDQLHSKAVICKQDAVLWTLHRNHFMPMLIERQQHNLKILARSPLFGRLPRGSQLELAMVVEEEVYEDGNIVLSEEDALENQYLYFIVGGSAKVARTENLDMVTETLPCDSYFGHVLEPQEVKATIRHQRSRSQNGSPAPAKPQGGLSVQTETVIGGEVIRQRRSSLIDLSGHALCTVAVGKTICFKLQISEVERIAGSLEAIIDMDTRTAAPHDLDRKGVFRPVCMDHSLSRSLSSYSVSSLKTVSIARGIHKEGVQMSEYSTVLLDGADSSLPFGLKTIGKAAVCDQQLQGAVANER